MAKVQVEVYEYICDVSGVSVPEDEIEERKIKWEGKTYALDLAPGEASTLDTLMEDLEAAEKGILEYVAAAKKKEKASQKGRKATKSTSTKKSAPHAQSLSAEIREWARANGWPELGSRGRIPEEITNEYNSAHGL